MASEQQQLEEKIIKQVEYYFGDINLPRDKFMQEKIKADENGWITLEVLLTFKRLASLSEDPAVIAAAIEKSDSGLVEVSEDKTKLRRNPDLPCPELNDARKKELSERTAYAKGFPLDEHINDILSFFEESHGPVESVSRRVTKDHKFKGSCFIIFKDKETCKKFIDAESIKYKDVELLRKWQLDYFAEKKKEYDERIKAKKDKKKAKLDEKCKQLDYPKGAVVHFDGIPEGKSITREEIKENIQKLSSEHVVAFIDFQKGDQNGNIRFTKENAAVEFLKLLGDEAELEVCETKLKMRAIQGEEEDEYLKKTAESVTKMREKAKQGQRNRKRKGHFQNGGRDAKNKRD